MRQGRHAADMLRPWPVWRESSIVLAGLFIDFIATRFGPAPPWDSGF